MTGVIHDYYYYAEGHQTESEAGLFDSAIFAPLAMLVLVADGQNLVEATA